MQLLCDVYRSEFCVKQEDVSTLFLLKCGIVYGIREVTASEKNLQLEGTRDMVYGSHIDLFYPLP